ncbi:MAG: hypothetical protein LBB94_08075 [Clostridiales bacterium]|jgi:hypothetical protein|nr:hypothetical protein [Clostridiales bacterium]
MGRKLTKSEKVLIPLLIAAVFAAGYYFLFWDRTATLIESEKTEISSLQIIYDDYQKKIGGLSELKSQLDSLKNQPSYIDKFYSADENQEVYMDFLGKLITDNGLTLDSVVFSEDKVELPEIAAQQVPENTAGNQNNETLATPSPTEAGTAGPVSPGSYFNLTTAVTTFYVDYDTPEKLLDALTAIEKNDKMVITNSIQLNVVESVPVKNQESDAARNDAAADDSSADNAPAKAYRCVAVIKFVSLAAPSEETSETGLNGSPAPMLEVPVVMS